MALQKQLVPLPPVRGLDTKLDSKQEEPGYLRKAENIVYETLKLLRKRNGYDRLSLDNLDGADLTDIRKLTKYNSELLAITGSALFAYSPSRLKWTEKGTLYPAHTTSQVVQKNATNLSNVDGIIVDQFKVFCWDDGTSVYYSVQDLSTNSFLISNATLAAGERPVLAAIQNDCYIIYGDGANVKFKSFSILEPGTLSSATTVDNDRDLTNGLIDAQSSGTSIAVAYNADNSGDNLKIFKINLDGTTSSILGVNGETASHALNVYVDSNSRFVITYSDGDYFKITIYAFNLNAAILAPTIIDIVPLAAPTATLNLTADIVLTSDTLGITRNGDTVTTQVLAAAANPTNTVLVAFTGTIDAVTITITPNDGTNNAATPVNLTTAQLVTLINTGAVGTVTLTDTGSLRADLNATGGDATNFVNAGEGDAVVATFAGGTSSPAVTCTATENSTGYRTYWEIEQSIENYVKQADITLAGSVSGETVFCRGVGLAADCFEYNDTIYIATVLESSAQSSYILQNENGALVTKWANQTASSIVPQGVLPSSQFNGDDEVQIASLFRNRIQTESGSTFFSTNGVGAVTINFAPETCYSDAELAGGLHICAGFLKLYDGNSVTEHGFATYPENLSATSTATIGGFMSDGNYGYKAVYKWTDNTGRDHRSAPTLVPLEVILAGGGSTQTSTVRVPTLRLTEKVGATIELYRTEDDGLTYYKATSDLSPVLNDTTIDYVDIVDTISDATLIAREALYTTGDVLENVQAPAAYQITPYNGDRLAIVGENGKRVFWSKQTSEEQPIEFSDAIYRDVEPTGGSITTIKNMGSKLIIWAADATFYVTGEGPTNTGVQDTFTKPETLAIDIGCTNPNSVVLTPDGLFFKSRKGLWFCGANLNMTYKGAPMEAFNSQTVTAASIVGDINQIRFLLSESRALVYNYNLDMWATFENHGGLSSTVIGNQYYYLREDGAIYAENRASFSDVSSPIKLRMETGWLSVTELQGWQRVYQAYILANFKSAHKLRVRVAYNFVDAWTQEVIVNPADFIDPTLYGDDAFYGATSPYGGPGNLYQFRVDFAQQKCTSIKLLIEDTQSEASEGLTISGITFRVGVKEGANKLPTAQQAGTE